MVCCQHPGGEEVLLDEGAKDATEAFEDVGHSDEARELLEKYYVGDLDASVSLAYPNGGSDR
jgi:cytochrome b involved in lipid metabolism